MPLKSSGATEEVYLPLKSNQANVNNSMDSSLDKSKDSTIDLETIDFADLSPIQMNKYSYKSELPSAVKARDIAENTREAEIINGEGESGTLNKFTEKEAMIVPDVDLFEKVHFNNKSN